MFIESKRTLTSSHYELNVGDTNTGSVLSLDVTTHNAYLSFSFSGKDVWLKSTDERNGLKLYEEIKKEWIGTNKIMTFDC